MGGMSAYVAKVESEAGSEVSWGRNGKLTVKSAEYVHGEYGDYVEGVSGGGIGGGNGGGGGGGSTAEARFVGGRNTSRLGGDGSGSGSSGKRAFGGGGVGRAVHTHNASPQST